MVRLYFPWNNLGCLGLKIGERFYCDLYVRPYFGAYWRIDGMRYRIRFARFWRIIPDYQNRFTKGSE